jgi:hypothetical protein
MESCQQLVKSRTNIIRTHSALRSAQDAVGLGMVDFSPKGAFNICPPAGNLEGVQPMGRVTLAA